MVAVNISRTHMTPTFIKTCGDPRASIPLISRSTRTHDGAHNVLRLRRPTGVPSRGFCRMNHSSMLSVLGKMINKHQHTDMSQAPITAYTCYEYAETNDKVVWPCYCYTTPVLA
jgi:hypothetical protein